MKKLLVLALVLSVASLANAGMTSTGLDLKLVDNGNGTFGIESLTGYTTGKDLYFAVVGLGIPSGGSVLAAAPGLMDNTGSAINDDALNGGGIGWLPEGVNGVWGFIGDTAGAAAPAGLWFDGITFTGAVDLYEINAAWDGFTTELPISSIVPEPATMALLGLGALVLRRKK